MSRKPLTERIAEVGLWTYGAAVLFAAIGLVTFTKIALELIAPDLGRFSPYYALAISGAMVAFGLLDKSWRGLLLSAVGSAVTAVALVALVVIGRSRWDIFLFALPLTVGGAAGLGMLGHGILHASPGVARIGFTVIAVGYAAAPALAFVGLPFLDLRRTVQERDPQILLLLAFAVVTILVSVLTLVVGLRRARREREAVEADTA